MRTSDVRGAVIVLTSLVTCTRRIGLPNPRVSHLEGTTQWLDTRQAASGVNTSWRARKHGRRGRNVDQQARAGRWKVLGHREAVTARTESTGIHGARRSSQEVHTERESAPSQAESRHR